MTLPAQLLSRCWTIPQPVSVLRITIWLVLISLHPLKADEPLHTRIDAMIAENFLGPAAGRSDDAEFLRRISLDLNGTIPSADEAGQFLDDTSPTKRATLIEKLLNNDQYSRHMADVFDVMLMERRRASHVKAEEWKKYLRDSFSQNKPYDQLAREILAADGVDPAKRAAARFYLDREGEPNLLTREVGRIFFGRDLQCAQCHNHPLIDDYLQSEYHGLYAFLSRSFLFTDKKAKKSFLAEKAEGEVKFQSVFDESLKDRSLPALPGHAELVEPTFAPGEEYQVKPAKEVRPVPKYSRRVRLSAEATSGKNQSFNRNIVNRLWAEMMGRGLVHPVDLHHPDNPPSHPELLDMLADEFVARQFNIKSFLRELALSETYQRSVRMPDGLNALATESEKLRSDLSQRHEQAEKMSEETSKAAEKPTEERDAARKIAYETVDELAKANAAAAITQKPVAAAAKSLAISQGLLTQRQQLVKSLEQAAATAREVAKQLPGVPELSSAAEQFQNKSTVLTAEMASLSNQIIDQSTLKQEADDKLAAARQAAAEVAERLKKANQQIRDLTPAYLDQRAQQRHDQAAAQSLVERLNQLDALNEYLAQLDAVDSSHPLIEAARAELNNAQPKVVAAETEVSGLQEQLKQISKAHTEATARLSAAKNHRQEMQQGADSLAEAIAQLESTQEKIGDDPDLAAAKEKLKIRAEKLTDELASAQATVSAEATALKTSLSEVKSCEQKINTATAQAAQARQHVTACQAGLNAAIEKAASERETAEAAHRRLTEQFSKQFAVRPLRQLSPEQFAWATMRATGLIDVQHTLTRADFDKKNPLKEEDKNDAAKLAQRDRKIDAANYQALKGHVSQFISLFGAGTGQPQQDFFATVDQALYLANAPLIQEWLAPADGNLSKRLLEQPDPSVLSEKLYLSLLTRRPSEEETADVTKYLAARADDRAAAVGELIWALLTSNEFRFNH